MVTTGSTLEISVTEKAAEKVRVYAQKEGKKDKLRPAGGRQGWRMLRPAIHPQH